MLESQTCFDKIYRCLCIQCVGMCFCAIPVPLLALEEWTPPFFQAEAGFTYYHTDKFWNHTGQQVDAHTDFNLYEGKFLLAGEYLPKHYLCLESGYSRVTDPLNGNSQGVQDVNAYALVPLLCRQDQGLAAKLASIVPVGDSKPEIRFGKFGLGIGLDYNYCIDPLLFINSQLDYTHYFGFPRDFLSGKISLYQTLCPWLAYSGGLSFDYNFNGKNPYGHTLFYQDPQERVVTAELSLYGTCWEQVWLEVGGFFHLWGENTGCGGGLVCNLVFEY